jgi:F0F1-type ATP synthase assembly protein I
VKLVPRKPINADSNVGRGIEFAMAILLFLGLGYLVDNWLGTRPVFMIVMFLVAVVGQFAAMWYRYDASMAVQDAQRSAGIHQRQATTSNISTTSESFTSERGTA